MGVQDPLEMLDTEQGVIGLETHHESDTSDEDTQDIQAAGAIQKGKGTGKGKADKTSKKSTNPLRFTVREADVAVLYFVPQIGVLQNLNI